jgi:tellurium resistance protein TerZ
LSKGQKVSLSKATGGTLTRVRMGLGWDAVKKKGLFGTRSQTIDLDASCLLFNGRGELVDQVWFGQLKSRDGAVQHTGDNLTGDGEGDDESNGQEIARYDLTGSGRHNAQIMAKIARDGQGWSMTAIGIPAMGRTIHDLLPAMAGRL